MLAERMYSKLVNHSILELSPQTMVNYERETNVIAY